MAANLLSTSDWKYLQKCIWSLHVSLGAREKLCGIFELRKKMCSRTGETNTQSISEREQKFRDSYPWWIRDMTWEREREVLFCRKFAACLLPHNFSELLPQSFPPKMISRQTRKANTSRIPTSPATRQSHDWSILIWTSNFVFAVSDSFSIYVPWRLCLVSLQCGVSGLISLFLGPKCKGQNGWNSWAVINSNRISSN